MAALFVWSGLHPQSAFVAASGDGKKTELRGDQVWPLTQFSSLLFAKLMTPHHWILHLSLSFLQATSSSWAWTLEGLT